MTKRDIVHIEFPAQNPKGAGEFYQKLFGWHVITDDQLNYTMFDPHEGPGGGFSPVDQGAKVGEVLVYINSEDIEADLKQAAALGGTVVQEKMEIPNTGWFGMFKDPTGNTVGLYTSMNPQ